MKTAKITLLIAALILPAAAARAGLLEYSSYGDPQNQPNAFSLGLNCFGLARGGDPILTNPALLAESPQSIQAQITGSVGWLQEKRTREVFDSYDNSVGLNTDLLHSHYNYDLRSLSLGYVFKPGEMALGVGLGYCREYSFDYDYLLEKRDAFYYTTEIRTISGKGNISRLTGSVSLKPLSFISFGLGLSRLSGEPRVTTEYSYTDPTQTNYRQAFSCQLEGNRLEAGVWGRIANRIRLGLSAHTKSKLTGTWHAELNGAISDTNRRITYPAEYAFGLAYLPANEFPASVLIEYRYTPWQRLSDNLNPDHRLTAVNRYSLGIEHLVANSLPLRFGISYANSYLNRGIGLAQASLGTTIPAGPVALGIGASFGRRSYNLGQAYSTSDATTVTESLAEILLTVSTR